MIIIDKPDTEPIQDNLGGDLPPAYDALSIHQPEHSENPYTGFSAIQAGPVAGPSRGPPARSDATRFTHPVLNTDKSLPSPPCSSSSKGIPLATLQSDSLTHLQRPRARKHTSWLSLLPFVSSFSAKRVRQSVLSVVSDLVSPPRASMKEQKNVHNVLASVAETCAEHKLSLSTILQEMSIAGHTPMYWAVVNYREELLIALLFHSRPLSMETVSDIRCACLVSSNQALFHALRVCRPPFHVTDGIQVPNLRTASESLLLGNRQMDEVRIQQSNDQGFVVSFDIVLWQSRMKVIGYVSVEFIVCGRMWTVTFFSAYPPSPTAAKSGKSKKSKNPWYVMISLLESSPPTFLDSRLVVDVPSSSISEPTRVGPKLRDVQSMTLPSARDRQHPNRSSMYDYNYDGMAHKLSPPGNKVHALSKRDGDTFVPSSYVPPPTHPTRGSFSSSRLSTSTPPPLCIRLEAGNRKLGRRTKPGERLSPMETPTKKPETWSDRGVGYTSAAVSPLEEGHASPLLCENSRYLFSDGTLRGRLEARLTKPESSKDCVIC